MKKFAACLMACALCLAVAAAQEWAPGLGPEKPYEGVPAVDLDESMGYILLYPRESMPAEHFCGKLEIYLPREDVEAGEGVARVFAADGAELEEVNASDARVRPLAETELEALMWGGGVCVELPLSAYVRLNETYYVHMDEGFLIAGGGKLKSPAVTANKAWTPRVTGEYGVSDLRYGQDGEITFHLTLGGEAAMAVIYQEGECVRFDVAEYTQSSQVSGWALAEELNWGVLFLDEKGEIVAREKLDRP